jgi:hypothetical protein
MPSTIPKVVSVEVVAARPTESDRAMISQLSAESERPISETAFIVKVRLEEIPPATSHGWALYVGDTRIPKYWEYSGGIYFKVLDEEFLAEHQRHKLRFSDNGEDFIDTGVRLPGPSASRAARSTSVRGLPEQSEVLGDIAKTGVARGRAARKTARQARPKSDSRKRKAGKPK